MKGFELEVRVATGRGEVFWEETACAKTPEVEEMTAPSTSPPVHSVKFSEVSRSVPPQELCTCCSLFLPGF